MGGIGMADDVRQTVRREFDRLLRQEELEREQRIRDAQARDPGIAELLRERTRALTGAYARALAERRAPAREEIRAQMARMDAELRARLRALGLPEDYLDMRYRCGICRDLGYVGDAGRRDCECFRARLDEERRRRARLDMAGDDSFESFDANVFSAEPLAGQNYSQRDFMLRARDICLRYCDAFPGNRRRNMLLTGAPGLGKTFLLNCMANRLSARGVAVSYLTAYRMLGAMRESVLGEDEAPFKLMLGAELLIIDDLGSEPVYRNITIEMLFTLLNERMRARAHTLIATNLSAQQLLERYGDRVASRLLNAGDTLVLGFAGTDLRTSGRSAPGRGAAQAK